MKRLAALSLLALSCTHFQPATFERQVESFRREQKIPSLSVAIARGGDVIFAKGFGDATPDTLYPIGSITKTFTATLMLQLAEEGKLDLEKDVAGYVDWQVDPAVRIRHVLSHTSEGVPGTRFAYSSRFNWLDNVVEAATKESFQKLMTDRVLVPAGLTRTIPGETTEALAAPYRIDENGNAVPSKLPPMGFHSSSGLSSTVLDLAKYSIALDEHRLLSAKALERAYSPSHNGFPYGLGWFTQTVAGERVVWHTSWWPDAFSGLLVNVPAKRLTLVVLASTDRLVAPQRGASNVLLYPLANEFLRTVLGDDEAIRGTRLVSEGRVAEAIACCPNAIASIGDDDRLNLFGDSADPAAQRLARDAARRLTTAFPNDLGIRFNAALAVGKVRPSFRLNGPHADEARALLESILAAEQETPRWMTAWSHYLVAEHIAERDPARARELAERAKATNVDTDGLQRRIAELLQRVR